MPYFVNKRFRNFYLDFSICPVNSEIQIQIVSYFNSYIVPNIYFIFSTQTLCEFSSLSNVPKTINLSVNFLNGFTPNSAYYEITTYYSFLTYQFSSVQSLSCVRLFVTP